jgi:hypothetical protein
MQEQSSKAQESQSTSKDVHAYLETLREEVGKLNTAKLDTAGLSQEITVRTWSDVLREA